MLSRIEDSFSSYFKIFKLCGHMGTRALQSIVGGGGGACGKNVSDDSAHQHQN